MYKFGDKVSHGYELAAKDPKELNFLGFSLGEARLVSLEIS